MSNSKTSTSKMPSHYAYQVRDGKNGKTFWARIGAAWQHKEGGGFTLLLESVPLDGRITLRIASENKD